MKGISGFISKFADEYMKLYLETSRSMKFKGIVYVKTNVWLSLSQ